MHNPIITASVRQSERFPDLPPPSNTGVTDVLNECGGVATEGHLDWLAATFPKEAQTASFLPLKVFSPFHHKGHGSNGYSVRSENEFGAVLLSGGSEDMGQHLVMPGRAMDAVRRAGVADRVLCKHVMEHHGQVARLDLALDVYGGNLKPADFVAAHDAGCLKSPARDVTRTYKPGRPDDTFYLGAPSSDRRLRVYDKNAEQGIVDRVSWLRLELQLRKTRARAYAVVVAVEESTRAVINSSVSEFLAWENEEYNMIVKSEDAVVLPDVPRKITERERWYLEQVIPSLVKFEDEQPGAIDWFWAHLEHALLERQKHAGKVS